MSGFIIQKVWEVGGATVVTIPKKVQEKIPGLSAGNYVQIYIEEDRLVIEPVEFGRGSEK